jgi:hypothetical protein
MQPQPDSRWSIIVGRVTDDGVVLPMSYDVLHRLSASWEELLPSPSVELDGPSALLKTARSLFALSWFDYEFMAVGCLVAFQAMEAAFRLLYPDADKVPARKLVHRAEDQGILPANIAAVADAGFELRNRFSHPATQSTLTVGMAASMLENTHRLVALVVASA